MVGLGLIVINPRRLYDSTSHVAATAATGERKHEQGAAPTGAALQHLRCWIKSRTHKNAYSNLKV